ncbi:DNA-binding protein [Methylomicrobium lacus]|uniref:DNA-binding protein n=1 Tax=Methylomicrobium lacus TaxID=136992 RepID=UPI0035A8E7F4
MFEAATGVKAKTWANVENGIQRANEEHIEAIIKKWPEYAYWLVTGLTLPEAGQISPELEETRQKLQTGT